MAASSDERPSDLSLQHGGFDLEHIPTRHDFDIATYVWKPSASPRGVIFLLHGINYHTTFEWLSPDLHNKRVLLRNSFIQTLLSLDLVVVAHDHPGHGRSSGLRVYVDVFDVFSDVFVDVVNHFLSVQPLLSQLPKFALGFSMGATTLLRAAILYPGLIDAHILISPAIGASHSPGLLGRLTRMVARVLSKVVPKLQIFWLPRNPDPVVYDAVDKDDLIAIVGIRARLAYEFLRTFDNIRENIHHIAVSAVLCLFGANDETVSKQSMLWFSDALQTDEKAVHVIEDVGHDIFHDRHAEASKARCIEWIRYHLEHK